MIGQFRSSTFRPKNAWEARNFRHSAIVRVERSCTYLAKNVFCLYEPGYLGSAEKKEGTSWAQSIASSVFLTSLSSGS
jgi:hypothetical protein